MADDLAPPLSFCWAGPTQPFMLCLALSEVDFFHDYRMRLSYNNLMYFVL